MIEQMVIWLTTLPVVLQVIGFTLLVIIQVVIAIIPGEPFELAAGYIFGFWQGSLICLIGGAMGTLIIYWLVERWGKAVMEKLFSIESIKKTERIMRHPTAKYGWIVLYMIPGTPKDVFCYLAPLCKVPVIPWLCLSTIGRIPSVMTSTGLVKYVLEGQWYDVIYILAFIGILAMIGFFLQRKLEAKEGEV